MTLNIITEAFYVRMQEPAYGDTTSVRVCAAANISQPLRRLVVFDYYRMVRHDRYVCIQHYDLPQNRPFSISPGSTVFNSCFDIRITGDDNIDLIEKEVVIIIEPVSPLDSVTASNITIVLEDNPSKQNYRH